VFSMRWPKSCAHSTGLREVSDEPLVSQVEMSPVETRRYMSADMLNPPSRAALSLAYWV